MRSICQRDRLIRIVLVKVSFGEIDKELVFRSRSVARRRRLSALERSVSPSPRDKNQPITEDFLQSLFCFWRLAYFFVTFLVLQQYNVFLR